MINTERVTLESLLDPTSEFSAVGTPVDFEVAVMECAEAFEEIAVIEQNLTTFEAAKIVKKAKSAKKKVKVTKTKMKAKDAKAKKKGGKVLKITKEGDENVDGGTGPLPTTSDTNGLTDTDLDAAPDAEVTVTEIAPDAETVAQDEVVGTEGADFVVEYEDASIVTLEAEQVKQQNGLIGAVKKLWEKIVNFVKSIIAKIKEWADFDKKYFNKNKAAIAKGLASETAVKALKVAKNPKQLIETVNADLNKIIGSAGAEGEPAPSIILGVDLSGEGAAEAVTKAIFVEDKPAEVALKASGWDIASVEYIVCNAAADWAKIDSALKGAATKAIKAADKNAGASRKAGNGVYRGINTAFRAFNRLRGEARKIMHTAGKAGGGDAGSEKGAE